MKFSGWEAYSLENLQAHAGTPEGQAFLAQHRQAIRVRRDQAQQAIDHLETTVTEADELLQRFDLVLDQHEGTA